MKLTFIGTSHGVPSATRHCSSAMLEVGENVYVFDAGAPVVEAVLKSGHKMDDLKAVFITHSHSDHTGCLFSLVDLCNWYFRTANVNFYIPEMRLWEGIDAYRRGTGDSECFDPERLHPIEYNENTVYDDGTLHLSFVPTKHLEHVGHPAYGFVIEAEGKRILLTGDMSQGLRKNDFPAVAFEKHFDIIISEMAHFGVEEMRENHEKVKCDKFIYTHVNRPETRIPEILALNGQYPYPVIVVEDGDTFEL